MKVKAVCAICGKTAEIEIDDVTRKILGEWQYFGKVSRGRGKYVDYFECPNCVKEELKQKP